jgi:hypothetical protein
MPVYGRRTASGQGLGSFGPESAKGNLTGECWDQSGVGGNVFIVHIH